MHLPPIRLPRRTPALLLAAACLAWTPPFTVAVSDAVAATYTWTGTNALWSSSNWVSTGGTSTFPAGNSGTNTAIINSGTVSFGVSDTFGNADTTSSPVIRIGSGATLASGGFFTTLYNLELNGGTLLSNGGVNAGVGTFQLGGTLSVGGNTASSISTGAGSNNVINVGAAANSVLTLNVADVTNDSAADLTIGTVLQNYYQAGVKAGSLTKAGAGTAVLTAANTYTGTTNVNAGTLVLSGANNLGGAMNVNGGVLSVTGTTTIGTNTTTVAASGTAQMNVSGNYTTQNVTVGGASGAVGTMVQTGGVTSITQAAGLANFQIGAAAGAFGYYGMTGGSLAVNELGLGGVNGGAGTIGILDVSGGTFDINGWLTTNRSGNGTATSVLNLGGNGTVISRGGNGLQSFGGTNVYNIGGSSTLRVSVATASALGAGDFNLVGGTLETNAGVTSAGRINLNGGTIKALASGTVIGTTTGGVTVYGGGVTINTNGYNSTITPALVAASGTGVSAVAITNAGSGYVAPPLVTITGGGGTGATGFATIANGTISGISIVNPGTGYTSAPTVTLSGGGGSGATFGTVTMAANTAAGGLTKTGAGTLTLSGSSSYTGGTTIQAGLLALAAANRLADSGAVTVNAGGFDLGGFSDTVGAVTLVSGSIANGTLTGSSYALQSGTVSAILAGGGPLTKSGAGIAYLTNNNTYSGTTTIASGTLGVGNGGTAGSLGTGPVVNNGSLVFDRYTNNWTVASPISGSGSVTKRGGASMTLSGSNTFTGDFNQWGGITYLSNTNGPALYADGLQGRIVISNELGGATYWYATVAMSAANQLGPNVDVSFQPRNLTSAYSYIMLQGNDTTIGNLSSTQAYASSWAIIENTEGGTGIAASRLTVTQTVDGTFTGEFRDGNWNGGSGGIGLTKNGPATLTLVDVGTATYGINYTGSTIVNAGKLVVSGTNFNSAVSTSAGATFEIANGTSYTLKSAVVVSGSGVFAKSGAGTLTLSGTNTNTGGLVVNGGALQFTTDAQLGGAGGGITLNGGELYNNNSAPTIAAGRTITLGTAGGYVASGWSQTTTVAGRITGQGGLGLAFDQGTLMLSGSNDYAGSTAIGTTAGPWYWANNAANPTLKLGNVNALPTGTPLVFGTSANNNTATLDLNGYSASVGGMTAGTNAVIDNTAVGTATLTMGPSSGTSTFAGVIKNTSGAVSVVKAGAGTQVLTGANTYTGTTTISAGTLQVGNGGTTGAIGGGAVVDNGQLAFNRSNALTVSAAISGTGGVSQVGTGTTTLTGGNTFTGNYAHAAGVTVLNHSGGPALFASGSGGTVTITNSVGGGNYYSAVVMGSTNQLGSNVNVSIQPQNVANGLAYFVLQGNDTTIGNLSSTQAYASSWAIVENQETGSYGNSRLTVTQTVDGTFTGEFRNGYGTSVGTLGLTKNGAATLTLTPAGGVGISYTGSTSINAGTLRLTGSAASPSFGIAAGAVLDLSTGTATLIFGTRTYAGGGTLRKTGAGLLAWSGSTAIALDSTGTVDVQEGTLQASVYANQIWTNNQSSLNVASGAVFAVDAAAARFSGLTGSGTVRLGLSGTWSLQKLTVGVADANSTFAGVIANGSGTAPFEKIGTGTLTFTGANTYSGTTTITAGALQVGNGGGTGSLGSGAIVDNASLVFNRSGFLTVANVISGSGSVTQAGPGTTTLTAASSYSGGTTITAGILATSAADRLLASGSLTVSAPGTFQLGGNQTLASIAGNGAIALGVSTLTTGSSSSTFAGSISGNGGLTKIGPGTLTLSGSNSFLGDTDIQGGTLVLSSATALSRDAVVTMQNGTVLTVNQRTFIGALDQCGGTVNGGGELVSTLTLTNSGSLNAVLADGPDYAAGILKRTSGTTTVGAANTFTGSVKVQGGTLRLAAGGSFAAASSLVMSAGATMDLAGKSQEFASVNGAGGTVALGSGALVVNNAANNEFGGAITGSGGLVKQDAGRFLLTGANTYTGTTTVQAGELKLNGSLASVLVDVSAAATLSGTGTLGGDVTIAGIHSPGNSPGVQTVGGNLTYSGGASVTWELAGNTADLADRGSVFDGINVGGNLAFTGTTALNLVFNGPGSLVNWNDPFWDNDRQGTNGWLIYQTAGTTAGLANFAINGTTWLDAAGNSLLDVRPDAQFGIEQVGGNVYLTLAAVPEPDALVLAGLGVAMATWTARRRAARSGRFTMSLNRDR
ncbi:MAG: autotransporter-associated beta strand repeat-containing protein [Planctomycetaceae bacterium]